MMNRSMPPGTIIPELGYHNVGEAAVWLCLTFGFTERLRIGEHRAQLSLGDGSIVVTRLPDDGAASMTGHSIMVRVDQVDDHYRHALDCGAMVINPPADFPYGERQYVVEDLGGHRWTFSQTIADVDPVAWGGVLLT